jgi:hypothetical protein
VVMTRTVSGVLARTAPSLIVSVSLSLFPFLSIFEPISTLLNNIVVISLYHLLS